VGRIRANLAKWRKALGVKSTEGDYRLRVAIGKSPALWPALTAMHAKTVTLFVTVAAEPRLLLPS
jgi:hypothetical protein